MLDRKFLLWEVANWESSLRKFPLEKMALWKYLTFIATTWGGRYGGDAINGFRPLAFVGLNDKLYRFSVSHLIKNSHFCLNLISFS